MSMEGRSTALYSVPCSAARLSAAVFAVPAGPHLLIEIKLPNCEKISVADPFSKHAND